MDTGVLSELVDFLSDARIDVRRIAIQNILPLTNTADGIAALRPIFPKLISALIQRRGDHRAIAHDAIKSLINLAQDENAALLICAPESLRPLGPVTTAAAAAAAAAPKITSLSLRALVDSILDKEEVLRGLYAMLLNNLSRHASVQARLFSPIVPGRTSDMLTAEMAQVLRLLGSFVEPVAPPPAKKPKAPKEKKGGARGKADDEEEEEDDDEDEETKQARRIDPDPLRWLGSVMLNVTQLPEYRRLLVGGLPFQKSRRSPAPPPVPGAPADAPATAAAADAAPAPPNPDEPQRDVPMPIFLLLPLFKHPDVIRRGGAVGTVRNCLRELEAHLRLLNMSKLGLETDILTWLAEPLVGAGEYRPGELNGLPAPLLTRIMPSRRPAGSTSVVSAALREIDPQIRMLLVQSLVLLTSTRRGREDMRARSWYYPVLREYHKWEPIEDVGDQIYRIVEMLIRDETSPKPALTASGAPGEMVTDEELAEIAAIQQEAEEERARQRALEAAAAANPPPPLPPGAAAAPAPTPEEAEEAAILASLPAKQPKLDRIPPAEPVGPVDPNAMTVTSTGGILLPSSERAKIKIDVHISDTPTVAPVPLGLPSLPPAAPTAPAPERKSSTDDVE
ncbi:hypothetical protein PAPYR_3998 [Paratrimastix pyriformis]|uniref:Protein HGH1 homolog n=1 Tax=Paratrimastix pyriformis TaxID=342808 RepID=A0ABQ8UNR0_9EUKA|nr:hypothetical protein PAPYR_3998 [Paratrimastix pyriformis]